MVRAEYVGKEAVLTLNPMEQIRTFLPRATRSLWTLPDPFLGMERCPPVLYTLFKFHPATRNGLGCTWGR